MQYVQQSLLSSICLLLWHMTARDMHVVAFACWAKRAQAANISGEPHLSSAELKQRMLL